jgi:hypothetical protein
MGNFSKGFSLLFVVILAVSSLIMVESANAQSITKPSIPQFTLMFQDNTYVVQPTTFTTTDPYTGKQTTTGSTIGAYVANASITVRITNQPFTPYTDANNNTIQLYYDVRWKGQFADSWEGSLFPNVYIIQDSSKDYTDVRLGFTSNYYTVYDAAQINWHALGNPVDIQVEACTGYVNRTGNPPYTPLSQTFIGETSGWSNTQTITASNAITSPAPTPAPTLNSPTPTPTQNPTPTPTVPEFSSCTIPLLFIIMLATAGLLVYHKKHKHNLVKKV